MSPENSRKSESVAKDRERFTYADYLELRGWEFDKFRDMPPISEEEISATDWEELIAELLKPSGRPEGLSP